MPSCMLSGVIVLGWLAGYAAIKEYWDDMWQQPMGDMPDGIVRDCCAQHAVTRPALLRYSKVSRTGALLVHLLCRAMLIM
jgi:hypothetical protein